VLAHVVESTLIVWEDLGSSPMPIMCRMVYLLFCFGDEIVNGEW